MHTTVPQNFTKIAKICNYLNWNLKKYYLCSIITLIEEIMKKMKSWMLAAILIGGSMGFTSCHNDNSNKESEQIAEIADESRQGDCEYAIGMYLTDSVAAHYSPGEVSIPCIQVVGIDDSNPDSVLVWGDFWVFNYNVAGDTLKMVSGGAHPGMMVVQHSSGAGYAVTAFDRVGDGSEYLASAKRIFGDLYDFFHKVNSDEESREAVRANFIASYVKEHKLPVKFYQDYGWPAKEIPTE